MAYAIESQAARGRGRTSPRTAPSSGATAAVGARVEQRILADDSGSGLSLFLIFIIAVLLVTGAVAFLALVGSWWALGLVFGVHALVTFLVGAAVFAVLADTKPTLRAASGRRAKAAPHFEPPPQAPVETVRTYPLAA